MAKSESKTCEIASVVWLQQRLRLAAKKRRVVETATLLCVAVALFLLSLAAYELADWLVKFPRFVRVLLTLGGLVSGVLALRRYVPRWIPRLDTPDQMARLVEQVQERAGRPAHSRLVASIEFGQRPEIAGDVQLKNRVIREAQSECADPCSLRLYSPRHVRWARNLGVAAALVTAVCLLAFPGTTRVFLQRMLGMQVAYRTATMLVSLEWQQTAAARQNYPVKVVVRGRIPPNGTLYVRMPGRRNLELPLLTTEGTNSFSTVIPSPDKSFSFSFRMGDLNSDTYAVRVAEPMYVKQGAVQVEPPAYTGQHKATESLGSLSVPEGSRLTFVITPDHAAHEVSLLSDSRSRPMKLQADGTWTLSLVATNSFNYEITMQDAYGMQNADRLKRSVSAVPDAPPVIELKQPKSDSFVSVASLVPLVVQLRDDYGLTRMELAYDILQHVGEADVSVRKGLIPLEHAAVTGKVCSVEQMLRVADLNVVPGQRIVFRVSAQDNRPGKPNIGQSSDVGLQVVDPEELKRVLAAEMAQMGTLMRKLRDSEKVQEQVIAQRLLAEGVKP